jgi:hypothetical protein
VSNIKDIIASAKMPERSVPMCLRGDLVAEHEAAERELEQAEKHAGDSLAGVDTGAIADRITALEARMAESTVDFRLRAMPKPKLRALIRAHPPRRDPETNELVPSDRYVLVNYDTFFDALLKASVVAPALDDDDWLHLLGHSEAEASALEAEGRGDDIVQGSITEHQWDKLTDVAWNLNRSDVNIPFSRAASRTKRVSVAE